MGVKSYCGEESTRGIFLGGKGMSKFLTVGGTPPFLFPRRENPAKLPSDNLGTGAKEIE